MSMHEQHDGGRRDIRTADPIPGGAPLGGTSGVTHHTEEIVTPPPPAPYMATGTAGSTAVRTEHETESYSGLRDRMRWGPVWAGLVVTIGTYIVLQLALITSGLVDLPAEGNEAGMWSAAAAIVAFLLGGITAGASSSWGGSSDGLLHGIVMWAVALVVLILLASVGSGLALGALDTTDVFDDLTNNVDTAETQDTARDAAGWALIGLSAALAASAIGGAIGSKMWPRRREERVVRG